MYEVLNFITCIIKLQEIVLKKNKEHFKIFPNYRSQEFKLLNLFMVYDSIPLIFILFYPLNALLLMKVTIELIPVKYTKSGYLLK